MERPWGAGRSNQMKLYLFFTLMDALILLAYPIVFVISKARKIFKVKR